MLQQLSLQNKILCATFTIFLLLFYFLNRNPSVSTNSKTEENQTADTFIPAGHVLVPIQVENSEALGAVMGAFAVVDLYSELGGHSSLIAAKVKLIRAPLNPKQFAVLVSDSLSSQIMQVKVPFSVVLQNRDTFKANLEKNLLLDQEVKGSPVSSKSGETQMPQTIQPKKASFRKSVQIEYYETSQL